jgi:signal transduction histidine kinase
MSNEAIQSDVLGRLLVIQQTLDAMPSEERIREFTRQGLMTVPGAGLVLIHICDPALSAEAKAAEIRAQWVREGFTHSALDPTARSDVGGTHYYPVSKPPHLFGFLIVGAADEALFQPYVDLISNIANAIGNVLDSRLHYSQLSSTTELLLQRTCELKKSNQRLEVEVGERERAEAAQAELAKELARSNTELEQLAYVASHDLQEPLRMVSSYMQLLKKKYHGQLDAEAHEFIEFAVDGANRMQALINDLLAYSRVGMAAIRLQPAASAKALDAALSALRLAIAESGARIEQGDLPEVVGDVAQLTQLFQNLIANAIKFRGEKPLQIVVSAEPEDGFWRFSVQDNGIGIAPEYHERIFVMFQRLHRRSEYLGTGIGLAVCKKIVERHGGRIWVESDAGQGATFKFTLPMLEAAGQIAI